MTFYAFPSIGGFHHVRQAAQRDRALAPAPLVYRAKIKLHGSHAAVQVRAKTIVAQSRNLMMGVGQGLNVGFPEWLAEHGHLFSAEACCIFGEWCGPAIMNRAAITQIPRKIWAPFMIQYDESASRVIVEPNEIAAHIKADPDVFVLDWYGAPLVIDWHDPAGLAKAAETVNRMVAEVERRDPFVWQHFGIAGIGEGLVFYPTRVSAPERLAALMFKGKGDEHKAIRTAAATVDPVMVTSIAAFVDLFVTPARLRQGVQEACHGDIRPAMIGPFLAWLCADVKKESVLELAAAGLSWKEVQPAIKLAGRDWFLSQAR